MSEVNEKGEWTEVPSPFCGSGTDDLKILVEGNRLTVLENGCSVNTPAFEFPLGDSKPRVGGSTVSLETAIARAAELLKDTRQPMIGGVSTDVNGMRALLSLADQTGAVVDNMSFNKSRRNLLVLQDSGWLNTTLAEVKNRCDVLVSIGTDIEAIIPRFFERFMWNEESMYLKDTAARQVVYIGAEPSGQAARSPDGRQPVVLPCGPQDLPEVVAVLRALVGGKPVQSSSVAGIKVAELQKVADLLLGSKYGVVTWAAGSLDIDHGELTVQTICEMVKDLNKTVRCAGLPLAGKDGDVTAYQVCGWQTGYPTRLSFHQGYPKYDPYLFDTTSMIENGEIDALVWVSAFNANAKPPVTATPTIVIGRAGMTFDREPDVYIPVGTPGIDHAGHTYRLDSVYAVRLAKLRDSGLPSSAEVLASIEQKIRG